MKSRSDGAGVPSSRPFGLPDTVFLCAASALAIELCAGPMHRFAKGVGIVLFAEDLSGLYRFARGERAAELYELEELARGAMDGPLSGLALATVELCRDLDTRAIGTVEGIAHASDFLSRTRRANADRAREMRS